MSEEKTAAHEQPTQQQLEIQKIYLKDVSLETPNSPQVFTEAWQPEIQLQINTTTTSLTEQVHEVVLTLTATAKVGEKTAYLAEIQQAGVFAFKGFPKEQLGPMLGAFCPNLLFPYAREAIDSLVIKGGFPPLLLKPVNFDALYLQHMQAKQAQQAGSEVKH